MQKDLKIGMLVGVLVVIGAALYLATRPALSTKARMLKAQMAYKTPSADSSTRSTGKFQQPAVVQSSDDTTETQTTSPTPIPTPSPTTGIGNGGPVLSGNLQRNCIELSGSFSRDESPQVGDKAVDFRLKDIYGNEFVLSEFLAVKPVVMVFGSIT